MRGDHAWSVTIRQLRPTTAAHVPPPPPQQPADPLARRAQKPTTLVDTLSNSSALAHPRARSHALPPCAALDKGRGADRSPNRAAARAATAHVHRECSRARGAPARPGQRFSRCPGNGAGRPLPVAFEERLEEAARTGCFLREMQERRDVSAAQPDVRLRTTMTRGIHWIAAINNLSKI